MRAFFKPWYYLQKAFFHGHLYVVGAAALFHIIEAVDQNFAHGGVRMQNDFAGRIVFAAFRMLIISPAIATREIDMTIRAIRTSKRVKPRSCLQQRISFLTFGHHFDAAGQVAGHDDRVVALTIDNSQLERCGIAARKNQNVRCKIISRI